MKLRYFLVSYNDSIPPWEWDSYYPEEMYGRYFEEDINALVAIDSAIHERNKDKKK